VWIPQITIEGILPARGLSRVRPRANEPSRVTSEDHHSAARARNSCAFVIVANFSEEPLTIPKATVLGVTEEISETLADCINQGDVEATQSRVDEIKNRAPYDKLLKIRSPFEPRKSTNRTCPTALCPPVS
jgi:hypothetical protein